MVFGNIGDDSGTGVAFTRDPSTGENVFYGEYLINAQGEDVVAGTRTPQKIATLGAGDAADLQAAPRHPEDPREALQGHAGHRVHDRAGEALDAPDAHRQADRLRRGARRRRHGGGAHQTEEALLRVSPDRLNQLLRPIFDPKAKREAIEAGKLMTKGLNAGPGAASGKVVFTAQDAGVGEASGEKVILVREETTPEDIRGMNAAQGILTARGGMTCHAALVGRQMGKVCVVGCESLEIDYARDLQGEGRPSKTVVKEGDWISIDGTTGEVFAGRITTMPSEVLQVLLDKTPEARARATVYRTLRHAHGVGRRGRDASRCAPTPTSPTRPPTPSRSAPRASASAGPSTCSSRATGSTRCAR